MNLKQFYLVTCILGTLIPWMFFADFFAENGFDLPAFLTGIFTNGAAGGFSADVMISIAVFWVWSYFDARQEGIRQWWLVLPTGCFVGLSLALPLYLYLKCRRQEA